MSVTINRVIGYANDSGLSERLHQLDHKNQLERVVLQREDTQRRRLRVNSDRGTECLIAIPRDQWLSDGAVLLLEESRAIVVRMSEEQWLTFVPKDIATGIELGYFSGNLHWRVRFEGNELKIALEGPEETYLKRLQPFLETGRIQRLACG